MKTSSSQTKTRKRVLLPAFQRLQKNMAKLPRPGRNDPVNWRGRDLSANGAIMHYLGSAYMRPVGRGVVLSELPGQPHLDDVLADGNYELEIRVIRRM